MSLNAFTPDGTYAVLAAGPSSSNVAIPAGAGAAVLVTNMGPAPVVVVLGNSSVSITTADLAHGILINPGQALPLTKGANTNLAAVAIGAGAISNANLNLASGA